GERRRSHHARKDLHSVRAGYGLHRLLCPPGQKSRHRWECRLPISLSAPRQSRLRAWKNNPFSRAPHLPRELSKKFVARKRQVADPLAGGCEDRVAESGDKWRHSRFAYSRRRRRALGDVHVGLRRHVGDAGYGIVIEIRLLNRSVLGSDLSRPNDARAENCSALELRRRRLRIDDESGI